MGSKRLFKCDAEDCNKTTRTESSAFKHALNHHYHLLQHVPGKYACFIDECKQTFRSPHLLERHFTTKHAPPNPKRFPLPDLFPPKDVMAPVRASLFYHLCPPDAPTDPPGTCPRCPCPPFPSDTELARHIHRYHPADDDALAAVAHVPTTSCVTCPPSSETGKPPVLFSLAEVRRHYAVEHPGRKVNLDETKPLLRPVGVRRGLLRFREQRERWASREAMESRGEEERGSARPWKKYREQVFEGVGRGELGVSARMPVMKAKKPKAPEREEDHYWRGPWAGQL